jgi:hypothetical protein
MGVDVELKPAGIGGAGVSGNVGHPGGSKSSRLASEEKRMARAAAAGAGMRTSPYLPVGCKGIVDTLEMPVCEPSEWTNGEHSMLQIPPCGQYSAMNLR